MSPSNPALFLRAIQIDILRLLRLLPEHPEDIEIDWITHPGDREDWIEAVIRADAIIRAANKAGAALWAKTRARAGNANWSDDLTPMNAIAQAQNAKPSGPLFDLCTFGPHLLDRLNLQTVTPRDVPYAFNGGFQANSGREFLLCNLNDDEPDRRYPGLPSLTSSIRHFAGRKAVWKMIGGRLKSAPVKIFDFTNRLPNDCRPDSDFRLETMHLTGICALQSYIDMAYEYRIFVIDGEPIAGAGCIEADTPLDRGSANFSPRMSRMRNTACPIETLPDHARRYQNEAQRIADEIADADPSFPRTYALDLFTTPDNAIAIVELNPLSASGLYATDFYPIATRLIAAANQTLASTATARNCA